MATLFSEMKKFREENEGFYINELRKQLDGFQGKIQYETDLLDSHWDVKRTIRESILKEYPDYGDFDRGFELLVFPQDDGSIYGFYIIDNRKLELKFRALPFIEDFHYQDQTDLPENIPESKWEQRKLLWDSITKYGTTWMECGYTLPVLTFETLAFYPFMCMLRDYVYETKQKWIEQVHGVS